MFIRMIAAAWIFAAINSTGAYGQERREEWEAVQQTGEGSERVTTPRPSRPSSNEDNERTTTPRPTRPQGSDIADEPGGTDRFRAAPARETLIDVGDALSHLSAPGDVYLDPNGSDEFPLSWSYYAFLNPGVWTFDWININWLSESTSWILYQETPGAGGRPFRSVLATGSLNGVGTGQGERFTIDMRQHLPETNTTGDDQRYFLTVRSERQGSSRTFEAEPVTLIHQTPQTYQQAQQNPDLVMTPEKACNSRTAHRKSRRMWLRSFDMLVLDTSSTSGDGSRDEVYFQVSTLGPGTEMSFKRLPSPDDYYEAHNGAEVNRFDWTNQDEKYIENPLFTSVTLEHGEVHTVNIVIREQDNADLKSIRDAYEEIWNAIGDIASVIPGVGEIIKTATDAIKAAGAVIPDTDGHDTIGSFGVRFENTCGYIRTVWLAPKEVSVDGGKVRGNFIDVDTHASFDSRLMMMNAAISDTNPMFYPFGFNYGEYTWTGNQDDVWFDTRGTSGSRYRFRLTSRVGE